MSIKWKINSSQGVTGCLEKIRAMAAGSSSEAQPGKGLGKLHVQRPRNNKDQCT